MPAADSDNNQRARLLPVLFWSGVGLAPLAGLLLLLGNGDTALRVAAALAVLAVVLIGLSVALRPDATAVRLEMEETLLDEIDMLREDVREDIATAARATHQGLGERLQALQQSVDTMRGELDQVKQGTAPPPARAAAAAPANGQASVAPARANGAAPAVAHAAVNPPASAVPGNVYGSPMVPEINRAAPRSAPPEPGRARVPTVSSVPAGVFQHTETVQVTTRSSTYVDRPDVGDRSRSYGGFRRGETDHGRRGPESGYRRSENGFRRDDTDHGDDRRSWSAPPAPRRAPEGDGESWTEQKLRERYGRRSRSSEQPDFTDGTGEWSTRESSRRARPERPAIEPSRGGRRRAPDPEPEWLDQRSGEYEPYPGVRTGDRWAEVRSDDRGRELRLGERRTSVSSGDTGTEFRIEDRWAAVRREDNGNGNGNGRSEYGRSDHGRPDYGRRALPSAPSEPTWNDSWDEPAREREPRGRRRRDDRDDLDDFSYPATGSQRRIDYELSDERWR